MSQVEVNTMVNSVDVNVSTNTVDIDNGSGNILVIPQTLTNVVEVVTPGPQGPPGTPGTIVDTGSFATTGSNQFNGNQTITGSLTVSGSNLFIGPTTFSGDVIIEGNTTGSFTGSFSGSFIGDGSGLFGIISASYSTTASYSATASFSETSSFQTNIQFAQSHLAFFDTDSSISSSAARQWLDASIVINREVGTALNPEALFVFQPNTESINIVTLTSNVDDYSQLNVRNENPGGDASSDIVATANNGDEFYFYVNLGINSSNYNPGFIGGPNDAYLYSLGKNFHIGNAAADGSHLGFFVGGDNVDTYNKLSLRPNNLHEMTGSLDISEFLLIRKGLTVQDGNNNDILTVSESIVRITPNASDPVGTTNAGSIWFTSTAMYVGLD